MQCLACKQRMMFTNRRGVLRWSIRTFFRTTENPDASGERSALVVDQDTSLPVFQPNAYMLVHRQRVQFSTYRKELGTLIRVHEWAEKVGVDLDAALEGLRGLNDGQVNSLCDFLRERRAESRPKRKRENRKLDRKDMVIDPSTWSRRGFWAKRYLLQRMADAEYSRDPDDTVLLVDRRGKLAASPKWPPKAKSGTRPGMPVKLVPLLTEVTRPEHSGNPWSQRDRLRNWIIVRFWLMGFRLAEPLTLRRGSGRLNDPDNDLVLSRYSTVALRARSEDTTDLRSPAPTLKTRGRLLPLDSELARDLIRYVETRSQLPGTHRHPYLIVGASGQPLSLSAADRVWRQLQAKHPEFEHYSVHSLRHTADDMITEGLSKNADLTKEMRQDILNYWFGWSPTSKMSKHYAQGFLLEQTQKALTDSILRYHFSPKE